MEDRKQILDQPQHFNNREISWLAFNKRVLDEAMDVRKYFFERPKFISIFTTNLDEFFMVRVAGLKDQVKVKYTKPDNKSGLTPKEQLKEISKLCHELIQYQDEIYLNTILPQLKDKGIEFLFYEELSQNQAYYLNQLFDDYILPVITPLAIHANRPFPKIMNKMLNLAVVLEDDDTLNRKKIALVQVPTNIDRLIALPSEDPEKKYYVFLEDILSHFIHRVFQGYKISSISQFRITRNADLSIHEDEAEDLLQEIEKELQKRKWGAAVRLEILHNSDSNVKDFLKNILELTEEDVYYINGRIDYSFLFKFCTDQEEDFPNDFHSPITPMYPEELRDGNYILNEILPKKDIFLHHPYDSFKPIVNMLKAAAKDPDVLAIKQTLYRVSGNSPIIQALVEAAENGKQVTVLVELKARFDEESNIKWAKTLEKAGAHVIYGVLGLKTHSKILLIIRSGRNGNVERFVHLGTGNYNEKTARLYTDMGIITSKESFGSDATNFFNHLSGFSHHPTYKEIVTAPEDLRQRFIQMIDEEIENEKAYGNGHIIAKMNSLTDKPIILKLYEASCAGVKIDLIVRGICCLKPGIKEVSENITVRSIVGRFLEHSRIFYFHNNGERKVYLCSADWMTRNMDHRVEILFPIYANSIKEEIIHVLNIILLDNMKARNQLANGDYVYAEATEGEELIHSQRYFYEQEFKKVD